MTQMSLVSLFLLAVAVLNCMLLLPVTASPLPDSQLNTNSNETLENRNERNTLTATHSGSASEIAEDLAVSNTCPNCCSKPSNMDFCETGTALGPVDHVTALGMQPRGATDWSSCSLPRFPQANTVECFKTNVYLCNTTYSVHLNPRNLTNLQKQCPQKSISNQLISGTTEVKLNSPRYGCLNNRSKTLKYSNNQFCLYNVSVPNCSSGKTVIRPTVGTQSLENRKNNECTDYVQFFAGDSYVSERYCGNELNESKDFLLNIDYTEFMAVFWTDQTNNANGFKLVASCNENH